MIDDANWGNTSLGAGFMISQFSQRADFGLIPDIAPTYSSGATQPIVATNTTDSVLNSVLSWISSSGSSIMESASEYLSEAKALANAGMDKAYAKLEEAKEAVELAISNDEKIAQRFDAIPEGPQKEALRVRIQESKGFFSSYVLPAWQKFAALVGLDANPKSSSKSMALGVVPIVPIAAVVAALALSAVAWKYIDLQESILEDPAFSSSEKAGLLSSFSLGGITGNLKWPIIIGGIAIVSVVGLIALNKFKK